MTRAKIDQGGGDGIGQADVFRPRPGTDTWIFDLDDTLYPRSSGLHEQMLVRVIRFIQELIGCDEVEAARLHAHYYETYGTSLVGLSRHHGVEPADFLTFVHQIDITPIGRGEGLAEALAGLSGRRLVFTNGSRRHAERILAHLGVADLFEGICDIEACGFVGKPSPEAFRALLADHAVEPDTAIMFDDREVNLSAAASLGMQTVLIGSEAAVPAGLGSHIHGYTHHLPHFLSAFLPAEGAVSGSRRSPVSTH